MISFPRERATSLCDLLKLKEYYYARILRVDIAVKFSVGACPQSALCKYAHGYDVLEIGTIMYNHFLFYVSTNFWLFLKIREMDLYLELDVL